MPPLRIVIADDHASVRTSLRLLLECESGNEVVAETADGITTLNAAQDLQPDLLILDINMPQMNGLEVLQSLRSAGYKKRIVILSNHSEQLYIAAAMRLGVDAFISKGGEAEALLEAVRTIRQQLPADQHNTFSDHREVETEQYGHLLGETLAELEQTRKEWSEAG